MIEMNAPFCFFKLLIFLPLAKLFCHSQKLIQTSRSTKDSFMNDTNASQSKVCWGCRKLFSYDPPTKELSDEEFINTEATTLLGDFVNADVNIVDGNEDSYAISNSTSAEALVSTQAWNNFDTNNLNERSREGLAGNRATNSEMLVESGGENSMSGAFTVLSEDSRRMMSTSHFSIDILQPEVSVNGRNKEDLEETRASNSEKFGDSGDTNSMIEPLLKKAGKEDESHLVKPDRIGSSDPKNFEVSESAMSRYPKQTNAELEEHNLKSSAYVESFKTDHDPLSNFLADEPHDTQVTNAERQTSLLSNFEEAGGNGVRSLQYNQPIKIREETSEIINEATKITAPNRDNYQIFGVPTSSTESLPVPFGNNDKLQENKEVASYKNTIWTSAWNRKYLNFPEKIHPKEEEPEVSREVSAEWNVGDEKSNFPAINRDIKSSQENLEVSENADSTTKSPPVVTNVNGVVLEDPTKRLKSNRTLNLFESIRAECEKGGDSCLKCREISPYCHYNFRAKICFYADVIHGNLIYECGIRFVTADGYQPFWIALSLLIGFSVVVLFFLARAFYKRILQKDPITDMEVNDMRNIVHLIRDKRSMQKKLLKRIGQLRREVVVDELESERLLKTGDDE